MFRIFNKSLLFLLKYLKALQIILRLVEVEKSGLLDKVSKKFE